MSVGAKTRAASAGTTNDSRHTRVGLDLQLFPLGHARLAGRLGEPPLRRSNETEVLQHECLERRAVWAIERGELQHNVEALAPMIKKQTEWTDAAKRWQPKVSRLPGQSRHATPGVTAIVQANADLLASLDVDDPAHSCWACGAAVKTPTRAHIVAHSQGGTYHPSNFFLLCDFCHFDQPDTCSREVQLAWLKSHPSQIERIAKDAIPICREVCRAIESLPVCVQDVILSQLNQELQDGATPVMPDQKAGASTRQFLANFRWAIYARVLEIANEAARKSCAAHCPHKVRLVCKYLKSLRI